MAKQVDLHKSTYGNFERQVLASVRRATYGEDIGRQRWITPEEYDPFSEWLHLPAEAHIPEVASGAGGPCMYLTPKSGCKIAGVDLNENGMETANKAVQASMATQVKYQFADRNKLLSFDDAVFEAVIFIDSLNHLPNRLRID